MNLIEPIYRLEGVAEGWCICSMPDGRLAFQAKDHSLTLWDPESGTVDQIPLPHRVFDLDEMAPLDAVRLVSVGKDDCMAVWDTVALQELRRTPYEWNGTPYDRPHKVCSGDGWFALGFYHGHIGVYDSDSFELLAELPADDDQVITLQMLPGKRLLFGLVKGRAGVWNWSTGEIVDLSSLGAIWNLWWLTKDGLTTAPAEPQEVCWLSADEAVTAWRGSESGESASYLMPSGWRLSGAEDGTVQFSHSLAGGLAGYGNGGKSICDFCSMPGDRAASLCELGSICVWELPVS